MNTQEVHSKCSIHSNIDDRNTRSRPNTDAFQDFGRFRINYYSSSGSNASLAPTQDYIESVADAAEYARNILTTQMGYNDAPNDEDTLYDIYLIDMTNGGSSDNNYGLNTGFIGSNNPNCIGCDAGASFIEIDREYSSAFYVTSGYDGMRITVAHEFFHALQWGYVGTTYQGVDKFFFELSSTWIEDVIYPDINDYHNWLSPYLDNPEINITCYYNGCGEGNSGGSDNGYALALFGHYLSKVYDQVSDEKNSVIMRKIWENFDSSNALIRNDFLEAVNEVLSSEYNSSFDYAWSDFTARNLFNGQFSDMNNNIYYYIDQKDISPITIDRPLTSLAGNMDWDSDSIKEGEVDVFGHHILSDNFLRFNNTTSTVFSDYKGHIAVVSSNPSFNRIYNKDEINYSGSEIHSFDTLDKVYLTFANSKSSSEAVNNFNADYNPLIGNCSNSYPEGDVALNCSVNIGDIVLLIQVALQNNSISMYQTSLVDFNNDSIINIVDIISLINIVLS